MYYKDYIEERMNGMVDILESSDVVMEFFKLKKKEKRRFKEENTIEAVNKEINEIRDDIFKEIKKYRSLCEVIHGRLRLYTGSEIINSKVKKEDKTETHYYSGAEFNIIDIDTMEYRETVLIHSPLILEVAIGGADIARIVAEVSSKITFE